MRRLGSWLGVAVRRVDPRRRYAVQWEDVVGNRYRFPGTFSECDRLLRSLLVGGALEVAGFRPDGCEDTWLFPAACAEDYAAFTEVVAR